MKRILSILTIVLALTFAVTTVSHAWGSLGLPKKSFSRAIDKALSKERWGKADQAKEYWQEAIPKGEELMKALPEKAIYFMGTARCHYALGEYDKAITLYEQALQIWTDEGKKKLNESHPWVYVYLGLAYAQKGDAAKAIETWEQVPMTIGKVYRTIQDQIAIQKTKQTAQVQ